MGYYDYFSANDYRAAAPPFTPFIPNTLMVGRRRIPKRNVEDFISIALRQRVLKT